MSQNIILNKKYGITLSVLDNGLGIVHNNRYEKIYLNKDMSEFMSYYDGSQFNISSIPKVFNIDKVENMYRSFYTPRLYTNSSVKAVGDIDSLIGSPFCGKNVTNMREAYSSDMYITGSPACGDNVLDMSNAYSDCRALSRSPVCGENVINMSGTYWRCENLTGEVVCGNNVTNMANTYADCYNVTGHPVCSDSVTNMSYTYWECEKLVGDPVCSANTLAMDFTYSYCYNLTGSPVCGDNVTTLEGAYSCCNNLIGSPVCGGNVTNLWGTYSWCTSLTGSPVCGPKVTDMNGAYYNCTGLSGNPVCGNSVINMYEAYRDCPNLYGDMYCYNASSIGYINMYNCFNGRNTQNRLNIHVVSGSKFDTALYSSYSMIDGQIYGYPIYWTDMENGYFDTDCNTYIYNNLPYVSDIRIVTPPTKTLYNTGEYFNNSGMMVNQIWTNDFEEPCTDYTWSPIKFIKNTTTSVEIIKDDISVEQPVTVEGESLKYYELESGQTSYTFTKGSIVNPDSALYDGVYESNNKEIDNTQAVVKIKFNGYKKFTVYIRSYAESDYDYTIASTLDAASYPTSSSGSYVKAHTKGNQKPGTTISDYTKVEYENDGEEHFIYIVYRKDDSDADNADKGYFLIQMEED